MRGKILLVAILLLPLFFGVYELFLVGVNDPIKYIYTLSGYTALTLLLITTSISIVQKVFNALKWRKIVGLSALFYGTIHFLNFFILDMEFDILFSLEETFERPFIYLGMISFLIVVFLGATSTKRLFRKYKNAHKLIYPSIILGVIHFYMAQKALSTYQWIFLLVIGIIALLKLKQLFHKIH